MNFITTPWKYTFINKSCCRNSPVNCDVFPRLNLHHWKTDSPALQVPEAILIQTLEKGTQGLAQRRKEEYKLWELSEYIFKNIYVQHSGIKFEKKVQDYCLPQRLKNQGFLKFCTTLSHVPRGSNFNAPLTIMQKFLFALFFNY